MSVDGKPYFIADLNWKPSATEGPVPNRVGKHTRFPIWLPQKPSYAKDPIVTTVGDDIFKRILAEAKVIDVIRDDPWNRLYSWRRHPYFTSGWHKFRLSLPGFGLATGAFGIYLLLEWAGFITPTNDDHHHAGHLGAVHHTPASGH